MSSEVNLGKPKNQWVFQCAKSTRWLHLLKLKSSAMLICGACTRLNKNLRTQWRNSQSKDKSIIWGVKTQTTMNCKNGWLSKSSMLLESHTSAQNTGVSWKIAQVSINFSKTGFRSSAKNGNNFAKTRRLTKRQFSPSRPSVRLKANRPAKNQKMISWKKIFLVNRMQL